MCEDFFHLVSFLAFGHKLTMLVVFFDFQVDGYHKKVIRTTDKPH